MKQDINAEMMEEINSARNSIEKDQLLQKYGLIDPKLTEYEKATIYFEGNPQGWNQVNFLNLPSPWEPK